MSSDPTPPKPADPAALWWGTSGDAPPTPRPFEAPMFQSTVRSMSPRWEWRYSWWTGLMYGPIPVGLFIVVPLLLLLWR